MRVIIVSVLLCLRLYSDDAPLPNWIDVKRERKVIYAPLQISTSVVPPQDFRIPAEYEPIHAVLVSYTGYTTMIKEIAKLVSSYADAYVWVMSGPSTMSGVPADRYVNFKIPIDTVWMRDYGPFGLSKRMESVAIVDTIYRHYQYRVKDDAVPEKIAKVQGLNLYQAPLILDGGNFMVDSKGNLFMTERTYFWNRSKSRQEVDDILRKYFKVKNIYTFEYAGYPGEPLDGTGHIDMFIKLLSDDVVVIADCDSEPFKTTFNKAVDFFKNKTAPTGKIYTILRVKSYYSGGVYYTYTNSLIVNGNIIMPIYSKYAQSNYDAKSVYESAGFRVITINSDASISSGGSVHCVTQTIPDIGKIIKREESSEFLKEVKHIPLDPLDKILNISNHFIIR